MILKVIYTESAYRDLDGIFDYIADVLLEPVIAQNQTCRIMDAADSLDSMPLRHRLYEHEPWRSRGWRIMPVDNYLVFYLPMEAEGIVSIMRIMHGSRNVTAHLDDE
jgi:toxin ParE1/3/4